MKAIPLPAFEGIYVRRRYELSADELAAEEEDERRWIARATWVATP